jgi:hypothetical protein
MKNLKEVDYHAWHGKPQPDVVWNMLCIIGKEKQSALYISCLVKQSNNLE